MLWVRESTALHWLDGRHIPDEYDDRVIRERMEETERRKQEKVPKEEEVEVR